MNYKNQKNKKFDLLVSELCEEIDDLKSSVSYWKTMYETERRERAELLENSLQSAKKGIADALLFTLSIADNDNGDLVISKENRTILAERYKSKNAQD